MGLGGDSNLKELATDKIEYFSWDDIKNDQRKLLVIDNKVYDVTQFSKKHPGGQRIMSDHLREDATDAFVAFHNDKPKVAKYMKALEIGELIHEQRNQTDQELIKDFRNLRALAEKMNLFKASPIYFTFVIFHIVLMEFLGWLLIYSSGHSNWSIYFIGAFLLAAAQAQAGWSQHDFGHLSVFKSSKWNHIFHKIVIGLLKGASADWWNFKHFRHHAKTNVIKKDPDIYFGKLFLVGKKVPRELGEQKKGSLPYHLQQNYFFLIVPPFLLPLFFNIDIFRFLYTRKKFKEAFFIFCFYLKWFVLSVPVLGVFGSLKLHFLMRFIESHWFTWSTQMSHLPMNIDYENELCWFKQQLQGTCNIDQSLFNDWFTGHLNLQIEHHLFPTMPRNNLHKITPYVRSLCEKHKIEYQSKPLLKGFADIYYALKESGQLWYDAYHM